MEFTPVTSRAGRGFGDQPVLSPHFTDEDTEAQRETETCPKPEGELLITDHTRYPLQSTQHLREIMVKTRLCDSGRKEPEAPEVPAHFPPHSRPREAARKD